MKKLFAFLFAVMMIVTCLPLSVTAAAAPVITIGSVTAEAGQAVTVPVTISGNPGIYGAILTFTFPTELTLTNVTEGDAFTGLDISLPDSMTSPYTIFCDGLDQPATADGTILTFTFKVADDAKADALLAVTASYLEGDVVDADFKDLAPTIKSGGVTVDGGASVLSGDINSDGRVNNRDLGKFQQYLNDWGVEINLEAADINSDGRVNNRDLGMLSKLLNS